VNNCEQFGPTLSTAVRSAPSMTLVYTFNVVDFWGRRLEAMLANKRDAKVLTFEARR
jgi:hypothetical protein